MSRVRTVVAAEVVLLLGLLAAVGATWLVERGFGLEVPLRLGPLLAGAIAAAPAALWIGYFLVQDRHEETPRQHVIVTALVGGLVAAPLTEHLLRMALATHPATPIVLDPLAAPNLVRAFLLVAVARQVAIYATVRYTVYRTRELSAPIDGVIYTTAAALGYAAYLGYGALGGGRGEAFLSIAVARSVVTALAHACFASVLGAALGLAKFGAPRLGRRTAVLAAGLGLAILLDGQYVVVSAALAARGLAATPWRTVAYGFGFAAAVFVAASPLIRRLAIARPSPVADAA